ncbi:MAG: class II aldolase/adducin family protein, partial [Planctomycetota bacterium]
VAFFRDRPDVQSVLHCHPPHVNAFVIADGAQELMRPFFPETITEVGPVPLVPYGEPLTERLAENFAPYLKKYNAFLMQNHGLVIMSPWDIKWVQMCTDLLEMTAKHIILARSMGYQLTELPREDVVNLGNVMRTRSLPLFGAPGVWDSLEDLYFDQTVAV